VEAEDATAEGVSLQDNQLQAALLCHPSISQQQQLVALLQQTSREL
jgi:hypothetical protein